MNAVIALRRQLDRAAALRSKTQQQRSACEITQSKLLGIVEKDYRDSPHSAKQAAYSAALLAQLSHIGVPSEKPIPRQA